MSQLETLLARHLKCRDSEIARRRSPHYGMTVLEHNHYEYAVGAPGFTENYYGPEIKLTETASAYRLTPGGVDQPPVAEVAVSKMMVFKVPEGARVEADFRGFEVSLATKLRDGARTGRMSCADPNLSNRPQKGPTDIANAIHSLQAAVQQLESGETEVGIVHVKSVIKDLAEAFNLEDEMEAANPYAQWTTTCPKCHVKGKLEVAEVTLSATGERHRPCTPLTSEGFDVACEENLKDQSTEDEEIVCRACGSVFDLGDLDLHKEKPVAPESL